MQINFKSGFSRSMSWSGSRFDGSSWSQFLDFGQGWVGSRYHSEMRQWISNHSRSWFHDYTCCHKGRLSFEILV